MPSNAGVVAGMPVLQGQPPYDARSQSRTGAAKSRTLKVARQSESPWMAWVSSVELPTQDVRRERPAQCVKPDRHASMHPQLNRPRTGTRSRPVRRSKLACSRHYGHACPIFSRFHLEYFVSNSAVPGCE